MVWGKVKVISSLIEYICELFQHLAEPRSEYSFKYFLPETRSVLVITNVGYRFHSAAEGSVSLSGFGRTRSFDGRFGGCHFNSHSSDLLHCTSFLFVSSNRIWYKRLVPAPYVTVILLFAQMRRRTERPLHWPQPTSGKHHAMDLVLKPALHFVCSP